ncbi:MAG: hypothetical protein CVV64_17340 [Candidatus Wallbacteria bacterium HGW-Wallbacteria-1]|jgi:hypothetical protein|uniref:Uncharacterized protein n=1 Tax=Candidatus Wallbacteria bacterium HGW-Wallbacteria-1 TaxID=2013854 RepID=A0A2N1PKA6_9BACT|nr:MAG: hypothetical protein CVV64_17340 [Candidatus Wallbacteria bacterium HGW-Wallbacteria-1]
MKTSEVIVRDLALFKILLNITGSNQKKPDSEGSSDNSSDSRLNNRSNGIPKYIFNAMESLSAAVEENSGFEIRRVTPDNLGTRLPEQGLIQNHDESIFTNFHLARAVVETASLFSASSSGGEACFQEPPYAISGGRNLSVHIPMSTDSISDFRSYAGHFCEILNVDIDSDIDRTDNIEGTHLILRFPRLLMKYGPDIDNLSSPGFFCTGREINLICVPGLIRSFTEAFLAANQWTVIEDPIENFIEGSAEVSDGIAEAISETEKKYFFIDDILGRNWAKIQEIKQKLGYNSRIAGFVSVAGFGHPVFLGATDFIAPKMKIESLGREFTGFAENLVRCFELKSGDKVEIGFPESVSIPFDESTVSPSGVIFLPRVYGSPQDYDGPGPSLRILLAREAIASDWSQAGLRQRETGTDPDTPNFFLPLDDSSSGGNENRAKSDAMVGNFTSIIREVSLGLKYLACRNCSISLDKCHHRW